MNSASDYTILIVDDQASNLSVLSELLGSHGFKVLVARDGETALDIAQRAQPDLILLDVILPGMNGFEICRRLKAVELTEYIPVIFMTILERIEDKIQGFQAGAADYITKPFQVDEVLARVTTQLRLRRLTRDLQEANESLERRVAERTAQLAQVNQELQAEVVERKRSEDALAVERTLLRTVIDNLPYYIYAKDTEGRFILKNLADVRLMGAASPDEVIGKTDFDYYPSGLAEKYHADDQTVLRSGQPLINQEEPITAADGTQGWILTSKVPLRDTQGRVVGLVGIGRDISERKQAEEALQRYNQRLEIFREIDQRIVVAHSPDAVANDVLERLVHLIPCEWAGVVLYNEESSEARIIALQQTLDSYAHVEKKIPFTLNQILEQLEAGQSIVFGDLKSIEGPKAQLASHIMVHGLRSGVAVPLIAQNRLMGILVLASLQVDFFTPEHQSIAEEIGTQVAIAFHQTELNDQIARHNVELEQRVRERTRQLEAANEELQTLSQVKDEFVSNVSHELRTPITNLKLRLHLLAAQPDSWEIHLAVMSREIDRLHQIIESLLFLSRLDQKRANWNPTRIDLNQVISEFIRDRTPLAQNAELSLSFSGEPDLPLVEADVALWEQALSILLTNAFNYTPAGGQVEVSTQTCEREGQHWVSVTVNDTGLGISADEQTYLFERFFRGTAGRESGTPGTGLGLSIVQEIVDKHRGRVEVFSEGIPGKGTTFSLWLLAAESANEKQRVSEV